MPTQGWVRSKAERPRPLVCRPGPRNAFMSVQVARGSIEYAHAPLTVVLLGGGEVLGLTLTHVFDLDRDLGGVTVDDDLPVEPERDPFRRIVVEPGVRRVAGDLSGQLVVEVVERGDGVVGEGFDGCLVTGRATRIWQVRRDLSRLVGTRYPGVRRESVWCFVR